MKLLPANTRIPANVPHVRLSRGVLVPDAYAVALHSFLPLGDYVAAVTKATGIARAWRKITGGKCGCGQRQAWLNEFGQKLARAVGV